MSERRIYTPEEVKPLYDQIVPAYQEAFAGDPWYEVSKCADELIRCDGGYSNLQIGSSCTTCGNCPSQPAYEQFELESRFDELGASRPTAWYIENNEAGLTLAAIAWSAPAEQIATEKYSDVPAMAEWLVGAVGTDQVMWLDEVFANRKLKPKGNLQNFREMVVKLATQLDCSRVAYRTISPQMITAPIRNFIESATVYERKIDVPDRRDFVVIDLAKDQS